MFVRLPCTCIPLYATVFHSMRADVRRSLTIETVLTNVASPLATPQGTPQGVSRRSTPTHFVRTTPTSTPETSPGHTPQHTPRNSVRSVAQSITDSAISAAARARVGAVVHARDSRRELSAEEKREYILAESSFGMFTMTKYMWRYTDATLYLALPILIFMGQWIMFAAVVSHNLKSTKLVCESNSALEMKMLFISVCLIYIAQSVQRLDDLKQRGAKQVKILPEASYTSILDKIHEDSLTLCVQATNLWVVYTTDTNLLEAMFNCLAMSFLSELDNEFLQAWYATYRLEQASEVYDKIFVTHRQNARKLVLRQKRACFRYVYAVSNVILSLTMAGYVVMPVFAFVMLIVGIVCK